VFKGPTSKGRAGEREGEEGGERRGGGSEGRGGKRREGSRGGAMLQIF